MTLLKEKPPVAAVRTPKHKPALRRRYRAALALLTLLGLIGKTVLSDTQAVEAVVQVVKHLHLFGL